MKNKKSTGGATPDAQTPQTLEKQVQDARGIVGQQTAFVRAAQVKLGDIKQRISIIQEQSPTNTVQSQAAYAEGVEAQENLAAEEAKLTAAEAKLAAAEAALKAAGGLASGGLAAGAGGAGLAGAGGAGLAGAGGGPPTSTADALSAVRRKRTAAEQTKEAEEEKLKNAEKERDRLIAEKNILEAKKEKLLIDVNKPSANIVLQKEKVANAEQAAAQAAEAVANAAAAEQAVAVAVANAATAKAALEAVEAEEAVAVANAADEATKVAGGLSPPDGAAAQAAAQAAGQTVPGGAGPDAGQVTPQSVTQQLIVAADGTNGTNGTGGTNGAGQGFAQQLLGAASQALKSGHLIVTPTPTQVSSQSQPPNPSQGSTLNPNQSVPPIAPPPPKVFDEDYIREIATALRGPGVYQGIHFKITTDGTNITIGPKP